MDILPVVFRVVEVASFVVQAVGVWALYLVLRDIYTLLRDRGN